MAVVVEVAQGGGVLEKERYVGGIKLTIDAQLLTLRGPGGRGGLTTGGLTVEDEEG